MTSIVDFNENDLLRRVLEVYSVVFVVPFNSQPISTKKDLSSTDSGSSTVR